MPARREQLVGHLQQPRRVSGVRAGRRIVARVDASTVGEAQRDRRRWRGGVEAEHDHRCPSPPAPGRSARPAHSEPRGSLTSMRRRSPPPWLSVTHRRAPASAACSSSGHSTKAIRPGPEVVGEQRRILALEPRQPVEIEVRDRHPGCRVAVADAEGGAGDGVADAERARGAAHERGLARAELATHEHDVARRRAAPPARHPAIRSRAGPVVSTLRTATRKL